VAYYLKGELNQKQSRERTKIPMIKSNFLYNTVIESDGDMHREDVRWGRARHHRARRTSRHRRSDFPLNLRPF
jgi:hypothetical protein